MQSRPDGILRMPAMERRHQIERTDRYVFGNEGIFAGREFAGGGQESPSYRSHDHYQSVVSFVSRPLCSSLQRDSKAFQNSLSVVLAEFS